MIQRMLLNTEAQALETSPYEGLPQQGLHLEKWFRFQILLILVVASGMLLKVQAYNPLATIAVLERGRTAENATICAISQRDHGLSCWDSPDSPVFSPQAGKWIGIVAGGTFMCGLQYPNRNAVCWSFTRNVNISVPDMYNSTSYKDIAAGEDHVCAIRDSGHNLDCWDTDGIILSVPPNLKSFKMVTAGNGWTCTPQSEDNQDKIFCWMGKNETTQLLQLPSVNNITFKLLSAGELHLCALYDGNDTISGQWWTSHVECWGLGENRDGFSQVGPVDPNTYGFFPDKHFSYNGLVSGPRYTCSMHYVGGTMDCWSPPGSEPLQLSGFQDVRFSESGIAASGTTICGVGLNDKFALRSVCGKVIPQPLVFLLPALCSSSCSEESHYRHDNVTLQNPFDQRIPMVHSNFCPDQGTSLCLPCYNRPSGFSCPSTLGATMSPHVDSSNFPDACHLVGIVSIVLSAMFAVLALFLYVFKASFESEQEGGRLHMFTKLTSVEHFCQHQAMFMMNLIEFSYKDLALATNGFHVTNLLGQGSSGCVFKGVLLDKRQVAVKKLSNKGMHNQSDIYSHFDRELKLLARLRHKNLVNIVGYCHQRSYWKVCCWSWPRVRTAARIDYRLLVFEYMPNGTLYSHLHHKKDRLDRPFLDWDMRLRIAVQAARGISYLHFGTDPPIIHRDIKSSNILLDERWNARLSDLGISRLGPLGDRSHILTSPAGTLGYLDPEYYCTQHLTLKSDVYSFGVVLLEVLTGCKAIEAKSDPANIVQRCVPIIRSGQAQSILDPKLPLPSYLDRLLQVADIAESCVRMVQQERPTIAEVLYRLEVAASAVAAMDLTPEP